MRKIQILVADDQAIDRQGLIALLRSQPDFDVVGEAGTAKDAAKLVKKLLPQVVIQSTRLPDVDGVTAISLIRKQSPTTRVLAIAERGAGQCLILNPPALSHRGPVHAPADNGLCTDCLQLAVAEGALGALRRDADPEDLFRAVRAVSQGNAWYEPATASNLVRKALQSESPSTAQALSSREVEVAGLIADGRSNKEIAQDLKITEPTVKKHVGHILIKLALQDRLQIGIYAIRNPLLFKVQK